MPNNNGLPFLLQQRPGIGAPVNGQPNGFGQSGQAGGQSGYGFSPGNLMAGQPMFPGAQNSFGQIGQAGHNNSGYAFSPGPFGGQQMGYGAQQGMTQTGNPAPLPPGFNPSGQTDMFHSGQMSGQLGFSGGFRPRGYTPLKPYSVGGKTNYVFQKP